MKIYYDLTELFNSSSKFKYYGIARVVAEIGFELSKSHNDVRYVIFSPAHNQFLEINPVFFSHSGALIDLPIDRRASPIRFRQRYGFKSLLGIMAERAIKKFCRWIDRRRWNLYGRELPVADLSNNFFVSAARPKIIVEYLDVLERISPSVKFIPFLHDMIPLGEYEKGRPRPFAKNFLRDNVEIIRFSHHVLCNSEFTKSEIERYIRTGLIQASASISAIKLAHECRTGHELPEKKIPDSPYLLTVGATLGRKNLECVFEALLHLAEGEVDVPVLAVAGVSRNRIRDFLKSARFNEIRDKVFFFTDPNQTDLIRLYEGSMALLMPTKLEGWGLPAGEALWLGTPVLCSNIPVLREVCGELGVYFDPESPAELAREIKRFCENKSTGKDLRANIRGNHHVLRSWATVAKDLQIRIDQMERAVQEKD